MDQNDNSWEPEENPNCEEKTKQCKLMKENTQRQFLLNRMNDSSTKIRLKDGRKERVSEFWFRVAELSDLESFHDVRLVCQVGFNLEDYKLALT